MGAQDPAEAYNGTIALDEHDLSERETDVLQRIALVHTNTAGPVGNSGRHAGHS